MMARIGRGEDYILTNADAWRIRTLQESGELLEGAISSVLVSKSVPVTQVQRLLGHVNVETTLIYCKTTDEEVKNSHKKYL